jgi:hypothetical protein
MTCRIAILILVAFFWPLRTLSAGERITDTQFGFSFTVPDGFAPAPDKVQGKIIHAFRRPAPSGQYGTFLVVSRMNGILDRRGVDTSEAARICPSMTVTSEKWQGFDISVLRLPQVAEGRQVVFLNAQIPLASEAIQVTVAGDESREHELRGLLQTVLAGLDGRSNWLSTAERTDRAIYLVIGVGVAIVIWRIGRARQVARTSA